MKAYERLLEYVKINTVSCESAEDVTPSSKIQFDLAKLLEREMKKIGISDVELTDNCYLYGKIPATEGYNAKGKLAFIAHLDTAPSFSGENVKPQIIENYDGEDVKLGESGRILSPTEFPHLKNLAGRTLITTDGTTLLGADDKSGIAVILTAAEEIINSGMPHGQISICFTPDEEIGSGAHLLDLEKLDADYGYTVDGGKEGEISYENFNACEATFEITGKEVHPGSSKNVMINASLVAMEINSMLPEFDRPEHTEDYEGFFHLEEMSGNVSEAKLVYIVREHDAQLFEFRQTMLKNIARRVSEKYGNTVKLGIRPQYRNMVEKIAPYMHLVENAREAVIEAGIEPTVVPVRGGTDGAQLSFRGLPCPDIGAGGYCFHGPYEHTTVEGLDISVKIVLGIIKRY